MNGNKYSDQRHNNLIVMLILAFPIVINSVKLISSLILLIFSAIGMYLIIRDKLNPFTAPQLKTLSYLTTGYFGVILLSGLAANGLDYDFHHLGRKLQFLLAPLIAVTIFKINFSLKQLLLSLKIGLIIIGCVVIMQYNFQLGEEWRRPAGMMNQNVFGDLAVMMLFLSITQIFKESSKEQMITLVGVICGIFAIVLSGSRGSWISALTLSLFWLAITYGKYWKHNIKIKLTLLSAFTVIVLAISNTQIVQNKVSTAVVGIQGWYAGDQQLSSAGERLNMWASGLKAAKDSPWIGYGYRNANDAVQKYTQQDIGYTHLHNEYITNLVSAGIIGLASLLALLLVPFRIFYQKLNTVGNYDLALMGLMLCAGYATFGFTHIAFGEEHVNAFYVLFLGLLLPRVLPKS